MAELFDNDLSQQALDAPCVGSRWISSAALDWQACGAEGGGFWIKPLLQAKDGSQKTWLMKAEPGAWSAAHAHAEQEQIYVLEGTFYDQEREYSAGDYIIRAAGTLHTAGSRDGATLLLLYGAPGGMPGLGAMR